MPRRPRYAGRGANANPPRSDARGGIRPRVPNLLLVELWRDDQFYLKVLAGRDDVLVPAQLIAIRQLASQGKDEQQICEEVGAHNVDQVKRVLAGNTNCP